MADIEGGPEPSKTVEAADRATHYAKPSVASESNSEAESNLRRKSAADLRRKVAAESLSMFIIVHFSCPRLVDTAR